MGDFNTKEEDENVIIFIHSYDLENIVKGTYMLYVRLTQDDRSDSHQQSR